MGGLTPCQDLVDIVLTPEEGVEKKVLDLGGYLLIGILD
jgi:hypothetical protein